VPASAKPVDVAPRTAPTQLYNITSTLPPSCSAVSLGQLNFTSAWFGWAVVAPPACAQVILPNAPALSPNTTAVFWPMAFSFFNPITTAATMVFCHAIMEQHDTTVNLTVCDVNKTGLGGFVDRGNVSSLGPPPNG